MNGNEMHGGENVILRTSINIVRLDEPLECKILFWLLGSEGGGTFSTLKFILASQRFFVFIRRKCAAFPFSRVKTGFETILNSGPSRAHLSCFCSYANLPVIVEATHRHSNSSVHINVALQ